MAKDSPAEYKKHEKELPYSVSDSLKGSAKRYNDMIEKASAHKRFVARRRAIEAIQTVHSNILTLNRDLARVKLGLEPQSDLYKSLQTKRKAVYTAKPSILSRIYNWFLNINYN